MLDCPASNQSGTGINKNADAGTSPVQDKRTHSGTGMLCYRTEIQDAGMPMPAASASIPMPSNVQHPNKWEGGGGGGLMTQE
jgi:hypothetical protein